jgi:hypothetical protein
MQRRSAWGLLCLACTAAAAAPSDGAAAARADSNLMVVSSFSGPVTQAEIDSFKAYVGTLVPATSNLGNAWVQGACGEQTKAMGLVYEVAQDPAILDRMLQFCDAVLSERNDLAAKPVGQYVLWTGRIDPAWPNDVTQSPIGTGGEQGDPIGHLGNCARLVLQTPALWGKPVGAGDPHHYGGTYLERAKTYVTQADYAWDHHVAASLLDLSDGNLYRFSTAGPYKPGEPVPWNQQMMFNYGLQNLAEAHRILADDAARVARYDAIVQANIDSFFKSGATAYTDADGHVAFNWAYALPAKSGEDSNHGSLDVAGMHRAFTTGRYGITPTQMTQFANTFVDVMSLGPDDYAGRVDGSSGDGHSAWTTYIRSGFLLLSQFRPDAWQSMVSEDLTPGVGTTAIDRFSRFLWVKNVRWQQTPDNLALGRPATASSVYSASYPAGAAADGNGATRWASAAVDGQWWQVDLGGVKSVDQFVLKEYRSRVTSFTFRVSADGRSWSRAYRGTKVASQTDTTTTVTLPKAVAARYVKLVCNEAVDKPTFWEIEVLGH